MWMLYWFSKIKVIRKNSFLVFKNIWRCLCWNRVRFTQSPHSLPLPPGEQCGVVKNLPPEWVAQSAGMEKRISPEVCKSSYKSGWWPSLSSQNLSHGSPTKVVCTCLQVACLILCVCVCVCVCVCLFVYLFIYLFLAVLGLRCCARFL